MRHSLCFILFCAVLALTAACTKPDRSEEADRLCEELMEMGVENPEGAVERVDSAQQAGVFTAVCANSVKALIYENAGRRRMAAYYAVRAIDCEKGKVVNTPADSNHYYTARWILADVAYANGEYGKSLTLAKDILTFVGDGTSPQNIAMKCRALTQMAECESELNHIAEAEQLLLQCVDMLMESTQHAAKLGDIDPLIYTLLTLNDLYIDNKMPERSQPLFAKMDTAMNRMTRCPDKTDWIVQLRRNYVTISKAMVYALNGKREQAEALFLEHRQSPNLDETDKTAEASCLVMLGRYDEALSLFNEADSMIHASGTPITNIYVKTFLVHKYDALQKAGRMEEALALGDYMRQLTDSLRQQERQTDVEQQQIIRQKEEDITNKHQSLIIHRIILVAAFLICLLIAYLLWRSYKYNKVLTEKNCKLYEEIEQREQAEAEEQRQLQSQPKENLTTEQQLYRRLCILMDEQKPYTDENLNRDTLAQLLGTNAKYVVQAIRECSHGETVSDFINRYRLEHIANLLKTTDDSIAIIGELSGIPSRVTLSRLFRNVYGMTCREYRQVSRQK